MNIESTEEPKWYVVHTYSGYENKVKDAIDATVDNRDMRDQILEIRVPTREVTVIKDGKSKVTEKKLFPGYVMVNMYMNDDAWYVIRNTRGVTGFVGPGADPIPLTEEELRAMGLLEAAVVLPEFEVGDEITVIEGPLRGNSGIIDEVITAQSKVRASLSMFGRQTPTELEFSQIRKIN